MLRLRNLLIVTGVLFSIAGTARAQGTDFFGGFSYEHFGTSPAKNINGLELTGQHRFIPWLGIAADLDGHFGIPSQFNTRTLHFMAGPQISLPFRFSPFLHVLAGVGHIHENGLTDTSVSAAIGGGFELRVAPLFSWRMIQADDVVTQFFGVTQHSLRLSTGLVFRF
jgi:hypothetical protein